MVGPSGVACGQHFWKFVTDRSRGQGRQCSARRPLVIPTGCRRLCEHVPEGVSLTMPFLKAHDMIFFFSSGENEPLPRWWFWFVLIREVEAASVGLCCVPEWSALVSGEGCFPLVPFALATSSPYLLMGKNPSRIVSGDSVHLKCVSKGFVQGH